MKIAGRKLNRKGHVALGILATMIVLIMLSVNFVSADEKEQPILNGNLEEIQIVVKSGDTAWRIQRELTPEENINEVMSQLKKINGRDLSEIKVGEVVKFATYK